MLRCHYSLKQSAGSKQIFPALFSIAFPSWNRNAYQIYMELHGYRK